VTETRVVEIEKEMWELKERKRLNNAQDGDRERYQALAKEQATIHRIKEWATLAREREIPLRLRDASFDDGQECPALGRTHGYVVQELSQGACLVLMGPTGVGKTYAAVAAIRDHLIRTGTWGDFWYFPALCSAMMTQDREQQLDAKRALKSEKLLVLDDFGGEYLKPGGFLESLIDEAIWYREGNILPTILTTNLMPDQMKERLSDRIVDRLRGDWGRLFVCVGESFRGKG